MSHHPKLIGTPFQLLVWNALKTIPKGEVRTYKELATMIGRPGSVRAVANACGKNPYLVTIPCHPRDTNRWGFGWIQRSGWY